MFRGASTLIPQPARCLGARLRAACAVAAVALAAVAPARGGPAIGGTIAFVQGGLYDIYVVEAGSREPAFVWDGPH